MKRQWELINKEYQRFTLSLFNLDTTGKVHRKEECERQMEMLEREIERLSKSTIIVQSSGEVIARPETSKR
eukprot:757464-Hanusia_phi.AAC.2